MNKYSLLIIVAIHAFCFQAKAQCPPHTPVTSINYEVKPFTYNRDYSVEELTSMHNPDKKRTRGRVMGSANGDVEIRVDTTFRAEPYNNQINQYCLNVKTIRATLYSMPKVFIASNFGRGTCEYATTLKHELKHVKMLKRTHTKELPAFRKYLNDNANNLPVFAPMSLSQINEEKQNIANGIKDDLQNYMKTIEQEVEIRQQEVDSEEEYDHVLQRCDRWDRK